MKIRKNAVLMLVTPMLSFGTLALGLEVGAYSGVHAATLFVEPPAVGARTTYLQLLTYYDATGVQEATTVPGLRVTVRARGVEHAWAGRSESDGFAIVRLDLPELGAGERVDVAVTASGEKGPLLSGSFAWPALPPDASAFAASQVPPQRREGDVVLTLSIPDQRLTVEASTPAWVRARDPSGRPLDAELVVTPEPGLEGKVVRKCPGGLTELSLAAGFHVTGLDIVAKSADGKQGRWFGAVPVAPGALRVTFPRALAPDAPLSIDVAKTNARVTPYLEIYDRRGRAFASHVLGEEQRIATVTTPPLRPGPHWLVVAGEPKAALLIEGSTLAHPFLVGDTTAPAPCELADLGQPPALRKTRFSLDGLGSRRSGDARKKRAGLALALGSLALGAVLEVLLLLLAAKQARREIERAVLEASGEVPRDVAQRTSAGSLVVGLLLAVLGFGLLASFLLWRD